MKFNKNLSPVLLLFSVILMTGCSRSLVKTEVSNPDTASEVLVYRKSSLNLIEAKTYLSENEKKPYLKLGSGDYGIVKLDAGSHTLRLDVPGYRSSIINTTLKENDRSCFEASPKAYAFFGGLWTYATRVFHFNQVDCPDEKTLKKYDKVESK